MVAKDKALVGALVQVQYVLLVQPGTDQMFLEKLYVIAVASSIFAGRINLLN